MTQNDSRAAFPGPIYTQSGYKSGDSMGMSLRDWFAGQALAGLVAHPACKPVGPGFEPTTNCVAREAFALADAMIAARDAK